MCKVPEEVVLTSGHQIMTGHNKIIDTIISNFPPLENELIVA